MDNKTLYTLINNLPLIEIFKDLSSFDKWRCKRDGIIVKIDEFSKQYIKATFTTKRDKYVTTGTIHIKNNNEDTWEYNNPMFTTKSLLSAILFKLRVKQKTELLNNFYIEYEQINNRDCFSVSYSSIYYEIRSEINMTIIYI